METLKREATGTHVFSVEAANREKRIIYLVGEINTEMAQEIVEQITYFSYEDRHQPIKIFINSGGGSIMAGLLIYDVIQGSEVPIELYCLEKAYSMAAVLFCSGQHGRYILPHSKVMIHDPRLSEGVGGNVSSIKELSEEIIKLKKNMDRLISKHTKQPLTKIEKVTKTDSFFSAEEAVKFGLADGVKSFSEMLSA